MSRNRKALIVLLCTIVSIGVIITLYAISPLTEELYRASFKRDLIYKPLSKKYDLDLGVNSFYIAGADNDRLYLGNSTAPFHLLTTNHQLLDSQHIQLNVGVDSVHTIQQFKLSVDSPYFFLTHGTIPEYLRGRIGKWKANRFLGTRPDYSNEAVPFSSGSLVLKSLSPSTKSYELAIKSGIDSIRFNDRLLNKQIDGIFCLDGKIIYDKKSAKIVYIHFYRNEFVVSDTSLRLLVRGHTIDTFSHAQIKLSKRISGGERMLAAPPFNINLNAAVYDNLLFVRSSLLSYTEDMHDFISNTVIDVYDINLNQYIKSFYIPNNGVDKVSSFFVYKNEIIAVCGNRISVYMLPDEISANRKLSQNLNSQHLTQ